MGGLVVPDIALRACGVLAPRRPPFLFPQTLPHDRSPSSALTTTTGLASGPVLQVCPMLPPLVALCGLQDLRAPMSAWYSWAPVALALDAAVPGLARLCVLCLGCVSDLCL